MKFELELLTEDPPDLETIEIEVEDRVVVLTLNRPKAFNAMSPQLLIDLSTVFAWVADLSGARAVVVTGAGKAFSSGGDINWFRDMISTSGSDPATELRRGVEWLNSAIMNLQRAPVPVIAALNGPAAGAGMSLALACDIRIASRDGAMICAYGRIGASPDGGLTWLLPRIVGAGRAMEILLEDPVIDAPRALDYGLVSEVVEPEELLDRSRARAAALAAKSPHYVRVCKQLARASFDNSLETHLQLERHEISDSLGLESVHRAVEAFLSGEEPDFSAD